MNTPPTLHFWHHCLAALRQCALDLASNAEYVRAELPGLQISADLQSPISGLCDRWIATKHDIFSELHELSHLDVSDALDQTRIRDRCRMMVAWLREDMLAADEVVESLDAAIDDDRSGQVSLAWMLVVESATNVLNSIGLVVGTPPENLNET